MGLGLIIEPSIEGIVGDNFSSGAPFSLSVFLIVITSFLIIRVFTKETSRIKDRYHIRNMKTLKHIKFQKHEH